MQYKRSFHPQITQNEYIISDSHRIVKIGSKHFKFGILPRNYVNFRINIENWVNVEGGLFIGITTQFRVRGQILPRWYSGAKIGSCKGDQ